MAICLRSPEHKIKIADVDLIVLGDKEELVRTYDPIKRITEFRLVRKLGLGELDPA